MAVPACRVPLMAPPSASTEAVNWMWSVRSPPAGTPSTDRQVTLVPVGCWTQTSGSPTVVGTGDGAAGAAPVGSSAALGEGGSAPVRGLAAGSGAGGSPAPVPGVSPAGRDPEGASGTVRPVAVTPFGRSNDTVTGSDARSPVLRTVMGRSTGSPPATRTSELSGTVASSRAPTGSRVSSGGGGGSAGLGGWGGDGDGVGGGGGSWTGSRTVGGAVGTSGSGKDSLAGGSEGCATGSGAGPPLNRPSTIAAASAAAEEAAPNHWRGAPLMSPLTAPAVDPVTAPTPAPVREVAAAVAR